MPNPNRDTRTPARAANIPPVDYRLIPQWKDDIPGNPFVNGDAVLVRPGARVMFLCPGLDTVTMILPSAGPGTEGTRCAFYELTFAAKGFGNIVLTPLADDSVGGHPDGAARKPVAGVMGPWFDLESDGNHQWNLPYGLIAGSTFQALAP